MSTRVPRIILCNVFLIGELSNKIAIITLIYRQNYHNII